MEHTDGLAADEQRYAEQRLDPLLAQNRVEHVRVVDVVEDHRLPLGRDPAGEAAADRNADAALYLLLESHRRPGHELVRLLVEQQHRARVDVEQLPHSEEEGGEQLLQLEVGERGVGERLQAAKALRVVGHDRSVPIAPPLRQMARRLAAHDAHFTSPFVSSSPAQPAQASAGRRTKSSSRSESGLPLGTVAVV